jgi:hypothetical protein
MTTRPDGMQVIGGEASTIRSSRAAAHRPAPPSVRAVVVCKISGDRNPRGSKPAPQAGGWRKGGAICQQGADRTSLSSGSLLQAPTSSTQDHQPHGAPRGRHRTPSPSPTKLRPTRRAWLLLWLTVALIAVANGGLLLRGASVTVMVESRSRSLPAGLTVAQVLDAMSCLPWPGICWSLTTAAPQERLPPGCWSTASRREQPDASTVATESRWPAARADSSP